MKTIVTILLLFSLNLMLIGQGINASFTLGVLPDNFWYLELKKDNNYKYLHWSGFGGDPTVLDSGKYTLDSTKLTLKSTSKKSARFLDTSGYDVYKVKVKRYQSLELVQSKHKIFTVWGKKFLVLTKGEFNNKMLLNTRPKDNIEIDTMNSNITFSNWINDIYIPKHGLDLMNLQVADSSWHNLLNKDNIRVALDKSSNTLGVFYIVNNLVYSSDSFFNPFDVHKAIISRLKKEKYLTRNESRILKNKIKDL
jgi:hypothetical protein